MAIRARYVAARSLVAPTIAGDTVTFTLLIRQAGKQRSRAVYSNEHRAISGRRETYYEKGEQNWSLLTRPLTSTEAAQMVMFLDSVEDGRAFEFDPGTGSFLDVQIARAGYDEPREPAKDSMVFYQFSLVEITP